MAWRELWATEIPQFTNEIRDLRDRLGRNRARGGRLTKQEKRSKDRQTDWHTHTHIHREARVGQVEAWRLVRVEKNQCYDADGVSWGPRAGQSGAVAAAVLRSHRDKTSHKVNSILLFITNYPLSSPSPVSVSAVEFDPTQTVSFN